MEPGIYYDLPRVDYDAINAMNYSTIREGRDPKTMAHMRAYMNLEKTVDTDAFALGRAAHERVYEPYNYSKNFCVEPEIPKGKNRGCKIYKDAKAELEADGFTILKAEEYNLVDKMWNSLRTEPDAIKIMERGGANEVSFVWIDETTGLLCKGRADEFCLEQFALSDLKTSRKEVSDNVFKWSVRDFSYDIQAALYMDGLRTLGKRIDKFTWLAVPKTWPYICNIITVPQAMIEDGREAYTSILKSVVECRATGVWPGYGGEHILELPDRMVDNVIDEECNEDEDYERNLDDVI